MSNDPNQILKHLEIHQLRAIIGKAKIAYGENAPQGTFEDLHQFVTDLTFPQRVELVSLMQVGRGIERFSINNWPNILKRQSANADFAIFVTGNAPLAEYLKKAADILGLKEVGFDSVLRPRPASLPIPPKKL